MNRTPPRLCFVGNMLGRNADFITSQGQIVADLFADEDYEVTSVSARINRFARLFDIIQFLIRKRRVIDLLILELYSGWYLILAEIVTLLAGRLNLPLIIVLHGGNLPRFVERFPRMVTGILKRADLLIAPSAYLADAFRAYGFTVRIIPNVVDIRKYNFRYRKQIAPRLLWMRSFHSAYNPLLAIDVLAKLRQSHPDARLVMAGRDKGLESEVKQSARRQNLENSVCFSGFLNEERKLYEFNQADIFINTNKIDNTPVAVIEACAMGLPVVSTDVGGIANLLENEKNGLLVPDDDAEAMVAAIKRILSDQQLAGRLSGNARKLAERSSWTAVRQLWEKSFKEVLR